MKSYNDIILKYLKKNKKRTVFTIIGIILSLSLISGVGFLGLSVRDLLYENTINIGGDYEFEIFDINKKVISILRNDVDLEKVGVYGNVNRYKLDGFEEFEIQIQSSDEVYLNEISRISKDYIVYSGHGEDTTLFEEFKYNPYLK